MQAYHRTIFDTPLLTKITDVFFSSAKDYAINCEAVKTYNLKNNTKLNCKILTISSIYQNVYVIPSDFKYYLNIDGTEIYNRIKTLPTNTWNTRRNRKNIRFPPKLYKFWNPKWPRWKYLEFMPEYCCFVNTKMFSLF